MREAGLREASFGHIGETMAYGGLFFPDRPHALPGTLGHHLGHMEGDPQCQVDADEPPGAPGDGQRDYVPGVRGWAVAGILVRSGPTELGV